MNKNLYSLGLMSGTSMDGIDVSIIKSDGEQFAEIIDDLYVEYKGEFKSRLKKIISLCTSKDKFYEFSAEIKKIEKELTHNHVDACKLIMQKNKNIEIDLIGFHGQTVLHKPQNGYTIQIGDPKTLSKLTSKAVVSNFRENDISNGGQGAPITPLYHQLILKKIKLSLPAAILNIGGISNITYLDEKNNIFSFDTGPGNHLIDEWTREKTKLEFDKEGFYAKSGKINHEILNELIDNSYFKKNYPKSLDIKDFNLKLLNKLSLEDGCATLSMLTVKSICLAVNNFEEKINSLLISGGGRKNKFIIKNIKKILKTKINLIDDFNFNGDFIESQAFAYLAIRSYLKKYITYPSFTGVKKPCLGGSIFKN